MQMDPMKYKILTIVEDAVKPLKKAADSEKAVSFSFEIQH
jgi:hypothetical protein